MASNATFVIKNIYDYMGRRVKKEVYTILSSNWHLDSEFTYIYDGWNVIYEHENSPTSGMLQDDTDKYRFYTWGLDISGTLQGAGGVGGLLAVVDPHQDILPQVPETFFPLADGNGNITEYATTNGTVAAHYEYNPFGGTIISSGAKANDFNFRFSTKYYDIEIGLYYYGRRYYSTNLGRWINRDPVGERAFQILYSLNKASDFKKHLREQALQPSYIFVFNDSINNVDLLGMKTVEECWQEHKKYEQMLLRSLNDAGCGGSFTKGFFTCVTGCAGFGPAWDKCFGVCISAESILSLCCATIWWKVNNDAVKMDRETTCSCIEGASDYDGASGSEGDIYRIQLRCDGMK